MIIVFGSIDQNHQGFQQNLNVSVASNMSTGVKHTYTWLGSRKLFIRRHNQLNNDIKQNSELDKLWKIEYSCLSLSLSNLSFSTSQAFSSTGFLLLRETNEDKGWFSLHVEFMLTYFREEMFPLSFQISTVLPPTPSPRPPEAPPSPTWQPCLSGGRGSCSLV